MVHLVARPLRMREVRGSILGPLGYGPNTLPLRHFALLNNQSIKINQVVKMSEKLRSKVTAKKKRKEI